MSAYDAALAAARTVGLGKCADTEAMAAFCDGTLQIVAGAGLSGKLVWQGAMAKGLTFKELAHLAGTNVLAVSELQWEG